MSEKFITLNEATLLTKTIADKRAVLLQGPPGIGKSSILKAFNSPEFITVYCDCARMSPEDLSFPVVDREANEARFVPNAHFKIALAKKTGKKLVIMLDEFGKARRAVANTLLPVLLENRLGDESLPDGSFVFATTNLKSDGVGDDILPHEYNRVVAVNVAGPTMEEWVTWAIANDIAPEVISWAHEAPQIFDCYRYSRSGIALKDNPYIYNPASPSQASQFCSPRSLAAASDIVKSKEELGPSLLLAALSGTIGVPSALALHTHIEMAERLPSVKEVTENPTTTRLPDGIEYYVHATTLAMALNPNNQEAIVKYVSRYERGEAKGMFAGVAVKRLSSVPSIVHNQTFSDLCRTSYDLHVNG